MSIVKNFNNLDTDNTLGGNNASDTVISSQKAIKEYVDNNSGTSRNIGEIIVSTLPLIDAGLHLLDGALIQGNGIYADFVSYIADLYTDNPNANYFTTESVWQSSITNYGVCGKFVYNSTNNTVRLPKITGIVEGTTDLTALGDLVQAGLPNITGYIYGYGNRSFAAESVSGAFTDGGRQTLIPVLGETFGELNSIYQIGLNASRSNSIYGNSSTVQPQTIKAFYYIVIATSTKTDIQVDIDEVVTDLNGKAGTDLSNMNASQIAKNEIISWGMPDYANGITITSGFVTPSKGWISLNCWAGTAGADTDVYINGIKITGINSSGGQVSNATQIPVDKNDTITYHNPLRTTLFFPMKGVN